MINLVRRIEGYKIEGLGGCAATSVGDGPSPGVVLLYSTEVPVAHQHSASAARVFSAAAQVS